jgi:transcriptional regulator with XRE-family HTH domain
MAEHIARTDLSDLVRQRRTELGLSARALADRCIDPETGEPAFKHAWLGKLEKADPTVKTPRLPYLRALAAALQLPIKAVQDAAAAQYMGLQSDDAIWSADHSTRITVARMGELSEQDRQELAELVELYARGKQRPASNPESQ